MPCMCGDYCCPSCGPAQGNFRCPICEEWASEGCEHFDEETGELKQEFVKRAQEIAKAEYDYYAQMAEEMKENGYTRSIKRGKETQTRDVSTEE